MSDAIEAGEAGEAGARKKALFCVALCAACLIAAFFFVKTARPEEASVGELNSEFDGRFVTLTGIAAAPHYASNSSGSFNSLLCAGSSCASLFIPASIASEIAASSIDLAALRSRDVLRVEGIVREDSRSPNGFSIVAVSARGVQLLS